MPAASTDPLLNRLSSASQQKSSYQSIIPKSSSGSTSRRPKTVVTQARRVSTDRARSPTAPSVFSQETRFSYSCDENEDLDWSKRLPYYLPCYAWLPTYSWGKFMGDFIAGLTLASFQIPLALSYATSIAHVPALCGLYSLAIAPMLYAIFGSVPQIVGPEAAISLVVGQAVEPLLGEHSEVDPVDVVSVLTCIGGFYLLGAGLCRFGFLDNVLSRALLRGFISAVGLVMIINSLFDELGTLIVNDDIPAHFHSPFAKIWYLFTHSENYHRPTTIISAVSFAIIFVGGRLKNYFIARGYRRVVFIPEILIVVVVSTFLSAHYKWQEHGVKVVGKIHTKGFTYNSPFSSNVLHLYRLLMSSGILAATLGFFESTTSTKSLSSTFNMAVSSNRELVALGSLNILGGFIGALPAFGGYGRSRINALSGAQTTMSGFVMGSITLLTIFCLLKYVYHLPICVLAAITSNVGVKLLEETPSDLRFHFQARGYGEIITFFLTMLATVFYSMEAGILLGVGYSVVLVIKNSAKSRIQILARLPNSNTFLNADEPLPDEFGDHLEEIEGCLIIKITEPLTFSNTSDLQSRLSRLERYGSAKTHPAAPRIRDESMNQNMIFDLNGLTYIDSSAAQIFREILTDYKKRGVRFYFARVPRKYGIRERLNGSGIYELNDHKYYGTIDEVLLKLDTEGPSSTTMAQSLTV